MTANTKTQYWNAKKCLTCYKNTATEIYDTLRIIMTCLCRILSVGSILANFVHCEDIMKNEWSTSKIQNMLVDKCIRSKQGIALLHFFYGADPCYYNGCDQNNSDRRSNCNSQNTYNAWILPGIYFQNRF